MQIFHQSVFEKWPIKDCTVQSVITSPPYFLLRKYDIPDIVIGGDKECKHEFIAITIQQTGGNSGRHIQDGINKHGDATKWNHQTGTCIHCNAWQGQYGLEPDFKLYLEHTLLWLQEAWRVLKDDGVIYIVIDDKFSGSQMGRGCKTQSLNKNTDYYDYTEVQKILPKDTVLGVKRKSKLCIPEELMVRMRNEGWCIRGNITWIRTMPESVKDRWAAKKENIIFATKNSRYYFNLDAVREPIKNDTIKRYLRSFNSGKDYQSHGGSMTLEKQRRNAEKFKEKFTKIKAEDAETIGSPRARYHRKTDKPIGIGGGGNYNGGGINSPNSSYKEKYNNNEVSFKNPGDVWLDYYLEAHKQAIIELGVDGYIKALKSQILAESDIFPPFIEGLKDEHYAPFSQKLVERLILSSTRVGDIVLDPFVGSGTTLRVAERLNRIGIGIDLGYQDIQEKRLSYIQKELIYSNEDTFTQLPPAKAGGLQFQEEEN